MPFINKIHRSGCCIYCIENVTKRKKYIGQSTNITFRRESHQYGLLNNKHPNKTMQEDFNSGDTFEIKVLEYFPPWVSKQFLNGKEYKYIEKYKTNTQGYNISSAPTERSVCKAQVEKYKLSPQKVEKIVLNLNKKGGLTFLRIYDLCKVLNCQPGDLLKYIPERTEEQ